MGKRRNGIVPNAHFKKHWEGHVKTWYSQPGKKNRRRRNRSRQQARPRILKPIVRCPTTKYNTKARTGKGFTLEELKQAGINFKFASTIGISVDHRRRNRSLEAMQANVQRLKEYKQKMDVK